MSLNSMDPCSISEDLAEVIEQELDVTEVAAMDEAGVVTELAEVTEHDPEGGSGQEATTAVAISLRRVSGRYRSCPRFWELELRVDVDGFRPMRRVSGDYYRISGNTKTYFGSFVVHGPRIRVLAGSIVLEGLASMTFSSSFNRLRVTIPRHNVLQPPASATALWLNARNRRGASYSCLWESRFFRTVELEQDYEKGVTPFSSYNTGALPSGGPTRTLTVSRAYAEAGVEMRDTGRTNEVDTAPGRTWSNAELHDAMERHFSRWRNQPQWKVWLFHANRHDMGPGLLGIMFDQKGRQRQGCATFYNRIGGNTPVRLRNQLYTCVHELGHCFNLFHSFHKNFMNPPKPNRPTALSWMNYPQRFPQGGEPGFWARFPFQFDALEVIHLRHAFRNNIIIGGNPFGQGAAHEDERDFGDAIEDRSGLRLLLSSDPIQPLGTPVHVNLRLRAVDNSSHEVTSYLDPKFGHVQLLIQRPDGRVVPFEHPVAHCMDDDGTVLDPDMRDSPPASAYVGYDREVGQVFDQAGAYKLRAAYPASDGSIVFSETISIRIRPPVTASEAEVADLMLGDSVGMLMCLDGSDNPDFQSANEALDTVRSRHAKHPCASYASLFKGRNASHEFKTISADNKISVRDPTPEAEDLLRSAAEGPVLNDILRMEAYRDLGRYQATAGKKEEAGAAKKKLADLGKRGDVPQAYVDELTGQIG